MLSATGDPLDDAAYSDRNPWSDTASLRSSHGWASPPLAHHSTEHSPNENDYLTAPSSSQRFQHSPLSLQPPQPITTPPLGTSLLNGNPTVHTEVGVPCGTELFSASSSLQQQSVGAATALPLRQQRTAACSSHVLPPRILSEFDLTDAPDGLLMLFPAKSEVWMNDNNNNSLDTGCTKSKSRSEQHTNTLMLTQSYMNTTMSEDQSPVAPPHSQNLLCFVPMHNNDGVNLDWITEVRDEVLRERSIRQEPMSATIATLSHNGDGFTEKEMSQYLL